ncbi:MAG: hypothetical protein K2V38_17815, partial [Gemmataceae bacterium]|nr:hypothetical protein [Gemmataceae bacterium]
GVSNAATVTVTVEDGLAGHDGQYKWTYQVTNTGFEVGVPPGIGTFALSVGDPADVSGLSNSLDWGVSVGGPGDPARITWQTARRNEQIAVGESATFSFYTSETGVQLSTGANFVADFNLTTTAQGPVAAPAPALLVTTASDVLDPADGVLSLREAVKAVNENRAGTQTIRFAANLNGATITLNPNPTDYGQFVLSRNVTIDTQGKSITIQRDPATATKHRLFEVGANAGVDLTGLTLRKGKVDDAGGAILSRGALRITNCTFVENQATTGFGGAVAAVADSRALIIRDSTFTGNSADVGGAISVGERVLLATISGGTVALNTARRGGGIAISSSTTEVPTRVSTARVDVNGNLASERGGGIYVSPVDGAGAAGTELTLLGNTIIQQNVVSQMDGKGGGVYFGRGTINLNGVLFKQNSATTGNGLFLVDPGTEKKVTRVTFEGNSEAVGTP